MTPVEATSTAWPDRLNTTGDDVLDAYLVGRDGARYGNSSPHRERRIQLQNDDREPGTMEPSNRTGSEISSAAYHDEVLGEQHQPAESLKAAMTSAMIDTAISSTVSAPISWPIGARTRARSDSATPASTSLPPGRAPAPSTPHDPEVSRRLVQHCGDGLHVVVHDAAHQDHCNVATIQGGERIVDRAGHPHVGQGHLVIRYLLSPIIGDDGAEPKPVRQLDDGLTDVAGSCNENGSLWHHWLQIDLHVYRHRHQDRLAWDRADRK